MKELTHRRAMLALAACTLAGPRAAQARTRRIAHLYQHRTARGPDRDEAVELLTGTLPDLEIDEVRRRLSTRKGFVWLDP